MYLSEPVHICVHVHICVGAQGGQKRVSGPLTLKTQEGGNHLIWYYEPNPSPLEVKVLLIAEPPVWGRSSSFRKANTSHLRALS